MGQQKSVVLLRLFPSLQQIRGGLSLSSRNAGKFIVDWGAQRENTLGRDLITVPDQGGLEDLNAMRKQCYMDKGLVDSFALTCISQFFSVMSDLLACSTSIHFHFRPMAHA